MKIKYLLLVPALLASSLSFASKTRVSIASKGVMPDSERIMTASIQKVIDDLSREGRAYELVFPQGIYRTGQLQLRDNVSLFLEKGAMISGSPDPFEYMQLESMIDHKEGDNSCSALIVGQGLHSVSISGAGVIDGNGTALALALDSLHHTGTRIDPKYNTRRMRTSSRPKLIYLEACTDIDISGIEARSSSGWGISLCQCKDVQIKGITVINRAYWNNDGIDLDDCRNVEIRGCDINSADDGICLKSETSAIGCDSIDISDCRIASSASALKFGTASWGGFRHVTIRNIYVYDTFRSAIALECVDGGVLSDVLVDGIRAANTGNAFFLRLGSRQRPEEGILRNITIRNMIVDIPFGRPDENYDLRGPEVDFLHNPFPASICGVPGKRIGNVRLENIKVTYPGRASRAMAYVGLYRAAAVPEQESKYPEFSMFGELPCWALYLRHVDGLVLRNVSFALCDKDYRPAVVAEDADKVSIENLDYPGKKDECQVFYVK